MTPEQTELAAAFREAAASPAWCQVDDIFETLMWSRWLDTPADAIGRRWDQPTYRQLVFVSIAKNSMAWSTVIRRSTAPWIPTLEMSVTLSHATKILHDPASAW